MTDQEEIDREVLLSECRFLRHFILDMEEELCDARLRAQEAEAYFIDKVASPFNVNFPHIPLKLKNVKGHQSKRDKCSIL